MFLFSMVLGTRSRPSAVLPPTTTWAGALTRSKMVAQVHREDSLRWPDEHPALAVAAGHRDVDRRGRRRRWRSRRRPEGLGADVVGRLAEDRGRRRSAWVTSRALPLRRSPRTTRDACSSRCTLRLPTCRRPRSAPTLTSGTATFLPPTSSAMPLPAGQVVLEAELEGQVLAGVAVVVDVDLVERVRVQGEVVRAAVGVLQRQVVGDEGDEALAPRLVAAEQVEVGAVDLGHGR